MLNEDRTHALFLRSCRRADAANGRCSSCEVRYKPVGFGPSDRQNPTAESRGAEFTPSYGERS
jgi:hypothetical protein